uniref:ATP-grasp domain-containing protein n=1 Tax=Panagrolaimus sp. ES5 TaxID=591445 RepID=A0AC34FIB7_9BILA
MSDFNVATINKFSKNDKEIYGFVRTTKEWENLIILTIYGAQSKKDVGRIVCERETFVMDFIEVFKDSKLKAFIFQIDGTSENVDFIRFSRINLDLIHVPYVFFKTGEQMRSAILVAANLALNAGNRIVEVLIDDDGYVVSELEYTEKGYLEREQRDCKPYKSMTAETIRQRILGPNNPVKIICHANYPGKEVTKFLTQKVLNNVPSSKLLVMEEDLDQYDEKFVFETVKWIFDKSYTKFYVCQKAFRNYMIRVKYDDKDYPLILCKKGDVLPFKQEVTIPKSFLQFYHGCTGENDIDYIQNKIFEIPKQVHALEFSLKVDVNNFMYANVRGLVFNKIPRFPALLDIKCLNIPIIGFYGELSFMYVKNDENSGYKLLDTWNGKLGKDLYISFDEEKPKFFDDAVKKFEIKGTSVVHDLIKIMSTSPTNLSSLEPTLGYTLSSNDEHPILIELNNYCGEKRAHSPSFFMALILKEHLKALKLEFGEKPKEIGFCLFDDFSNDPEAKARIQNGFKESCQMLQGLENECTFVDPL